jgi:Spy/CpxP family protein refolding chaperone
MTLYRKAKEFEAGQQIEFQGKLYPALYTPRNDTLINTFKITDDEQRQLQTIISKDMAAERHRDRNRDYRTEKRREAGAIERAEYEAQAKQKAEQAQQLRKAGWSIRAIAEKLQLSKSAVDRYVK